MDIHGMQVIFILSGLISIYFLRKIFLSKVSLIYKLIFLVVLFIPVLGPVFYLMIASDLEQQRFGLQNRSSPFNNLWGWGRYTDNWADRKEGLQKKIDALKEESINESNEDDNDLTTKNK